jgi:hypothetical protein
MKHIKEFKNFNIIKEESIYQDEFDILILKDINNELKKDDIVTIKEIIDHHIFITIDDISFSIKNFPEFEYWKEIEEIDDEEDDDINSTFSKLKNKF